MISETFCVNPWVTLHTKFTEGYSPCCRFNGTIASEGISQYVNSQRLIKIKQDLVDGIAIPECSDCWKQEAWGYNSKRQRDNQTYEKVFQALYKNLQTPADRFVEYYVRLGNHCNLRCTTCNDELSSGWISENKKFNIATNRTVEILDDSHEVWSHMRDHAATIGTIEFIGGEPFMMCQDAQRDLFKFLVDTGHASHIRIKYNTNGTRLPTEQLEYWSSFKAVEINVSVDGVGEKFEYLRYPAKWNQVEQNIEFYKNLQTTVPKLELCLMHTISILNVGYVKEMLDYCAQHQLKIFINILEHPNILNTFAVEPHVKSWVLDRINTIDHPSIAMMAKNLQQGDNCVTGQDILNFVAPLDQRRNLDVAKTFPELVECLKSAT